MGIWSGLLRLCGGVFLRLTGLEFKIKVKVKGVFGRRQKRTDADRVKGKQGVKKGVQGRLAGAVYGTGAYGIAKGVSCAKATDFARGASGWEDGGGSLVR